MKIFALELRLDALERAQVRGVGHCQYRDLRFGRGRHVVEPADLLLTELGVQLRGHRLGFFSAPQSDDDILARQGQAQREPRTLLSRPTKNRNLHVDLRYRNRSFSGARTICFAVPSPGE